MKSDRLLVIVLAVKVDTLKLCSAYKINEISKALDNFFIWNFVKHHFEKSFQKMIIFYLVKLFFSFSCSKISSNCCRSFSKYSHSFLIFAFGELSLYLYLLKPSNLHKFLLHPLDEHFLAYF